jgi:hypothetical protein
MQFQMIDYGFTEKVSTHVSFAPLLFSKKNPSPTFGTIGSLIHPLFEAL